MVKVAQVLLAADHAGVGLKDAIADRLTQQGCQVLDLGTKGDASVDYPDFGNAMGVAIKEGRAPFGIIVCGSGIGISIAANRHAAVRAALCHDVTTARLARQHNDANVLSLGARIIGTEVAIDCVDAFMSTDYDGGRHDRRVSKLGTVDD